MLLTQPHSPLLLQMSHELRTPLNSVIGFTSLALEEDGVTPRVAEYLREAYNGATALLKLITKVLEFSRLNNLGSEPRRAAEPMRLAALASEIVDICGPGAVMSDVELIVTVDQALFHDDSLLAGDRVAMRQIIVHLADNGIKFAPRGSGEVTVSLALAAGPAAGGSTPPLPGAALGRAVTASAGGGGGGASALVLAKDSGGRPALRPSDTAPGGPAFFARNSRLFSAIPRRTTADHDASRRSSGGAALVGFPSDLTALTTGLFGSRSTADGNGSCRGGGSRRARGNSLTDLRSPPPDWVTPGPPLSSRLGSERRGSGGSVSAAAATTASAVNAAAGILAQGLESVRLLGSRTTADVSAPRALLELTVRDNGPGIPQDKHGLLMRPFSQILSEDGAKSEGAGVGLASVKMLVDRMGGVITVASDAGSGTTFTVVVPLQRTSPTTSTTGGRGRLSSSSPGQQPSPAQFTGADAGAAEQRQPRRTPQPPQTGPSAAQLLSDLAEDGGGSGAPPAGAVASVVLAVRSRALQAALSQMLGCLRCPAWLCAEPEAALALRHSGDGKGVGGPPGLLRNLLRAAARPVAALADGAGASLQDAVVVVTDTALVLKAVQSARDISVALTEHELQGKSDVDNMLSVSERESSAEMVRRIRVPLYRILPSVAIPARAPRLLRRPASASTCCCWAAARKTRSSARCCLCLRCAAPRACAFRETPSHCRVPAWVSTPTAADALCSAMPQDVFLSRPIKMESLWRALQSAAQRPVSALAEATAAGGAGAGAAGGPEAAAHPASGQRRARRSIPGQGPVHPLSASSFGPSRGPAGTASQPRRSSVGTGKPDAAAPASVAEISAGNLRVMVVDDIALNLRVAVSLLKRLGVTVAKQAVNGLEAAEAAAQSTYDLILMGACGPPAHRFHDSYDAFAEASLGCFIVFCHPC